ncbi:MAG: YciI family protein [Hyphomonadaceae bacterium]
MSDGTDSDPGEVERLKAQMWKKPFFIMLRKNLRIEKSPALMLEHYRWIIGLEKRGVVFASGPTFERSSTLGEGMTVFRVDSFEAAEELAAGDPFVRDGAVSYEIRKWQINEGRMVLTVDFSDLSAAPS